jgi:hypothetical protein
MNVQIIDLLNPLWQETLPKVRHDTYHLPEYLLAEAKRTKTTPEAFLMVDGAKIFFLPYLLRQCDDILPTKSTAQGIFDAVSPYGYPGILLSEAAASTPGFPDSAIEELKRVFRSKNICSAFFRLHPILNDNINQIFKPGTVTDNGITVSVDLKLSASQIKSRTRKGHKSTINKCKRLGLTARIVPYLKYINEFMAIYEETMGRVEASQSYYFGRSYFEDISKLGDGIHLCLVEKGDQIASACLFLECGGIVQAHLGGSKTEFLSESPFSLVFDYGRYWSQERGNEFFHMGGGVGGSNQDSLYIFKSGFSPQRHLFFTIRLITDEEKYDHLVELRASALETDSATLLNSGFFPAYRALP